MTTSPSQPGQQPPVLVAPGSYSFLQDSVAESLSAQRLHIQKHAARFQGQQKLLTHVQAILHAHRSGLIALQGAPGSGVTSLLAHLVSTHPYAFWLQDEDAGQGATALCVQLIGFYDLKVPLKPPAAEHDPRILEQVLEEVATHCSADAPAVLVIDALTGEKQPRVPFQHILPATLPPHVVVLYGCVPGASLPYEPVARVSLPFAHRQAEGEQRQVLQASGCDESLAQTLVSAAQGNFLFLHLAYRMIAQGVLAPQSLQAGLDALYATWWSSLDTQGQRLALLLASAGSPLPVNLCSELLGGDAQSLLTTWERLGLIEVVHHAEHAQSAHDEASATAQVLPEQAGSTVRYAHWSLPEYVAKQHGEALEQMHADVVELARNHATWGVVSSAAPANLAQKDQATTYLAKEFSRHAALGPAVHRQDVLPMVAERTWIRNQERQHGALAWATRDLAWELRTVLEQPFTSAGKVSATTTASSDLLLRVGRDVMLVGTLASLTRALPPQAAVAALEIAFEKHGRENGLKLVLDVVNQLPDGANKAQILRQLGEVCYAKKSRTSAMRLLSQALDLEEQRVPPSWRDQRDHLLVAMVQTALSLEAMEVALEICEYINHREQRGMAETSVVRWLLHRGELVRARKVASAVVHESLTAWAQAEVVVAFARAGQLASAEMLLGDIALETAASWAQIELACDMAAQDEEAARNRIAQLPNENQRDHGYARLAQALAAAGHLASALEVVELVGDQAVRIQALVQMREGLQDKQAALTTLKQADKGIAVLQEEVRVPLVAILAAAYASLGYREEAFGVATQLSEGEERARALSRIAVALTQHGSYGEGLTVARSLADDDERDWTLAELTQVLAQHGHWQEAQARAYEIIDEKARARTLANLAIALARMGAPLAGLQLSRSIATSYEHARALLFIAPLLVASDYTEEALQVVEDEKDMHSAGYAANLQPVQIHRYVTAIALALAEKGELEQAQEVLRTLPCSFEHTRVFLSIAKVSAADNAEQAYRAMGQAMRFAIFGRDEAFQLLEEALPVLGMLGSPSLLVSLAKTVYDIDNWIV